jgi:Ras-related protein Rab-8A
MRTLNKSPKPQQKTSSLVEPQPQKIIANNNYNNNNNNHNNSNTTNNSNVSNTMINQTILCVNPLSIKNQTTINIIILGASKVGKSAFLIKITENTFEKLYIPTIYIENQQKAVPYNSKQYTLNFTVTATGVYKEDYTCVYNGMHFFLVFYDITNMASFTEAVKLYNKELKNKHMHYNYEVSNVFFVGNKVDEQPREVNVALCEEYCEKNKIKLFEISVKTHKNISQMLNFITHTFDLVAFSA